MFVVSFVTQAHKMVKISIFIILISHLFGTMIHCATPCSEYFTYRIRPETTGILGQIKIPYPQKMMNSI